jgi:integrase
MEQELEVAARLEHLRGKLDDPAAAVQDGRQGCRPVGAPLKAMSDATAKRSTLMLVNSDGQPWTPDGFRSPWRKACAAAGVIGVTFHDLRGTAVTRLALRRLLGDRDRHLDGAQLAGRGRDPRCALPQP